VEQKAEVEEPSPHSSGCMHVTESWCCAVKKEMWKKPQSLEHPTETKHCNPVWLILMHLP